jgi:gliding motility-associated lipoprotein GldH
LAFWALALHYCAGKNVVLFMIARLRSPLFALLVLVLCTCAGCLPAPYFQKQEAIPQYAWAYAFKPSFTFDITDTISGYQPYFLIRHSQSYPYSNVWLWVYVKSPADSLPRKERVNLVLAEPSGKWLGRGMGEIYEQRIRIDFSDSVKFNRKGTYQVSMEQNMRINPLPDIMNVGFSLVKKV